MTRLIMILALVMLMIGCGTMSADRSIQIDPIVPDSGIYSTDTPVEGMAPMGDPWKVVITTTGSNITFSINADEFATSIIYSRILRSAQITNPSEMRDYFAYYVTADLFCEDPYDVEYCLFSTVIPDPPPGVPDGSTYGCYFYAYAPCEQDGEPLGNIGIRGAMGLMPDWFIMMIGSDLDNGNPGMWEYYYEPVPETNPFPDPCE